MRPQILRSLIATAAIVITASTFGQELFITPKWKRDDLRTLYITRTQTLPTVNEAGEPAELVIPYKTASKVKVYDVRPEVVMVSIDHENMVLPMLKPYFETGFPSEVEPFRRMIIRYEVDRATGEAALLNATDIREFAKRAADHCLRAMRKKDPELTAQVEASLQPMMQQFENEASIAPFMDQQLGSLFVAFGMNFVQGAPIEIMGIMPAPFSATDSVASRSTYPLLSRSDEIAEVKVVKQLAGQVPAKGKASAPKATQGNDEHGLKSWRQEEVVTIDLKTTWPVRMSIDTRIELTDGSTASEVTSVEIR